jgi:hypothetical protein
MSNHMYPSEQQYWKWRAARYQQSVEYYLGQDPVDQAQHAFQNTKLYTDYKRAKQWTEWLNQTDVAQLENTNG